MMESRGFTVLQPETLTVTEQIRRFRSADVVIGEQGSGLHNTAFSARGVRVLCLHSERAQYFAQAGLGHVRDQPTGFVFGRQLGDAARARNRRVFEIDVAALEQCLEREGL